MVVYNAAVDRGGWIGAVANFRVDSKPTWRNGRRDRFRIYYRKVWRFKSSRRHYATYQLMGPWPSGKASPLQGEDRRFESDRVHLSQRMIVGDLSDEG